MSRVLVISLIACLASVSTQERRPVQSPGAQTPIFSSSAELVVAHVTVKDRQGAYVTSLPEEASRVFEDGTPQRIDFFTDESSLQPPHSPRQATGKTNFSHSPSTKTFAPAFRLRRPSDGGLSGGQQWQHAGRSRTVFRAALAGAMGAHGRTAMYDATSNGLSYVANGHHPRRVLVAVGDGGDNASTTTFDEVLKQAQRSNAAIYTVGVIDPLERDTNPGLLKRLAVAMGGESFLPRDVDAVDGVLQRIADDIRHSYTLGYVSSNPARDGRFRRIRIVAPNSAGRSLRVRTRDGYRAGGPLLGS